MPHFVEAPTYPEFPSGLPTAHLPRLSLGRLLNADQQASTELFKACRETGFFALDLRDHPLGTNLLDTVDPMFGIAENLFKLGGDEKSKYAFTSKNPLLGYKAVGAGKVDSKGTPDRCEIYGVSKDDVLSMGPKLGKPLYLERQQPSLEAFIQRSHAIVDVLSTCLDQQLGLPIGSLASQQRLTERSGNQVRFLKTPPAPECDHSTSLVPHTDVGSLTLLFNVLGGLQILRPGGHAYSESDWQFVKPERGCAIVNLGDAMVVWTNGILRSNMHRVTFPPGKQAEYTRYAIAYFARPENAVIMKGLDESELIRSSQDPTTNVPEEAYTAEEWEQRKGRALNVGANRPKNMGGLHS